MNGEMMTFPVNGETGRGYLSVPASGSGAGVIVLQEWWGLVDHIKSVADRFANAGFVALAPDLYHGASTTNPDEAGRLMMALDIERAAKDLGAAIRALRSLDATTSEGVGTVGFCMGGQLSLFAACENRDVDACVIYYGIHPEVKPRISKLTAPVLGFFGEHDEMVTPLRARNLQAQLKDAGKHVDFTIFPGAGHAFFNSDRPEAYVEQAANISWDRMIAFLHKMIN